MLLIYRMWNLCLETMLQRCTRKQFVMFNPDYPPKLIWDCIMLTKFRSIQFQLTRCIWICAIFCLNARFGVFTIVVQSDVVLIIIVLFVLCIMILNCTINVCLCCLKWYTYMNKYWCLWYRQLNCERYSSLEYYEY